MREHLATAVRAWHAALPAEDESISSDEEEAVRVARPEAGAIPWEVIKAEFGL